MVSLSELPDESPPKQLSAGYREHTEGLAAPYRVPAAYQSPRREEYDDQVALIEARAAAEAALSRAAASEYRLRVEAKERPLQPQP